MCLSNEPGYYQPGEFGIRIENVAVTKDCEGRLEHSSRFASSGTWLEMETITMVPLQVKMIDATVLSADTIRWVDDYQRTCKETLAPLLQGEADKDALAWLMKEAVPVSLSNAA